MLAGFRAGIEFTGDIGTDTYAFLVHHGSAKTASHCERVAQEAERVARLAGVDVGQARIAGWLHDISGVIPTAERVEVARSVGLELLPEEERFPMIIHQKLSVVIARDLFGVNDEAVLSAIGCHTTLKRDASLLDQVLFVADKIAWDQFGDPPFLGAVTEALGRSVEAAALAYLAWMREQPLPVVHPWLREAYEQLSGEGWGR